MSAKWRRSRKHLKWLDLKDFNLDPKPSRRTLRSETFKPLRKIHPQKYRMLRRIPRSKWKEPKPLIDMFQDPTSVTITAQIAGFNQETLKIHIKKQKLTLTAKTKDRRYYKTLSLPKTAIPNITRTTYKNGVLEIKLKKTTKQAPINEQAGINDAT
ncbi:MAG: Hsp20/alpha crystallin family protein [Candidatus Bathyarchaeia archaeon]